jgi:hypothetical protein
VIHIAALEHQRAWRVTGNLGAGAFRIFDGMQFEDQLPACGNVHATAQERGAVVAAKGFA